MNGCRILVGYLEAAMSWVGHINRTDSTRKVSQVFNNNPQLSRVRGRSRDRRRHYIQTDINAKVKTGKR